MPKITINKQALKYPPRIEFGSLQRSVAPDMYGNQIKMFCSVVKGERPLLPDYGLPKLIHKPAVNNSAIEAIFRSALNKYFPEVNFIEIKCENASKVNTKTSIGSKLVIIRYSVRNNFGTIEIELGV